MSFFSRREAFCGLLNGDGACSQDDRAAARNVAGAAHLDLDNICAPA